MTSVNFISKWEVIYHVSISKITFLLLYNIVFVFLLHRPQCGCTLISFAYYTFNYCADNIPCSTNESITLVFTQIKFFCLNPNKLRCFCVKFVLRVEVCNIVWGIAGYTINQFFYFKFAFS